MIYQWIVILKEAGVDQLLDKLNDGLVAAYLEGTSMYLEDTYKIPARLAKPIEVPNHTAWLSALTETGLNQLFDYIKDGKTDSYMHAVALYLACNYESPVFNKPLTVDAPLSAFTTPLDVTEEHEIIRAAPWMIVVVEFVAGYKQVFRNITEVHWLYPCVFSDNRVALETDVHNTGFTYSVDKIKSLSITEETSVQTSLFGVYTSNIHVNNKSC